MAIYDHKQLSVLINGYEISDWADGADVLNLDYAAEAGQYVVGADGSGVFVASTNRSATLALKLKQHSADNNFLAQLCATQDTNIKQFTPLILEIRDLLNDDVVSATKGYFTKRPTYTRGDGHNATSWTIVFEQARINLEKGVA